jgi:hypothetical protein
VNRADVVSTQTSDVQAARLLAARAAAKVQQAPSFRRLDPLTREALVRDLGTIERALADNGFARDDADPSDDPYALTLDTPSDRLRPPLGRLGAGSPATVPPPPPAPAGAGPRPPVAATETIAGRAGALSDEIDFPGFVASLVHGTFDAIVDATIRQMEAFADLIGAVAKDVDRFTRDNVTSGQVRAKLVEQYPADIELDPGSVRGGRPRLRARASGDEEAPSPEWLAEYGLDGEPLTDEVIEEQLVPAARRAIGEQRLQTLATMVLLGMNRVNVRDGTISARVRFRAAAADRAAVDYSSAEEAGATGSWASRGTAPASRTFISTVGVNVQADSDLKVELFGQVSINFVSETLPLERFVDAAQLALLQHNAFSGSAHPSNGTASPAAAPPTVSPTTPLMTPSTPPPGTEAGR